MKHVLVSVVSIVAAMFKKALNIAATPPLINQAHAQAIPTGRSRRPGKPGKAGDKMARHAAENRLGVRS